MVRDAAVRRTRARAGRATRCRATGTSTRRVERAPAPEPEIVFLGRVTPYKGLAVAIEALALLR